MITVTLSMYLVAGGLSACLCFLMLVLGRATPDVRLMRGGAASVALLTIALTVSGFGSELPPVVTTVGSNLTLLAAGVVIHSTLLAYLDQRPPTIDWVGWAIVALAAPCFWHWGLLQPNGTARSVVFSFAAMAINGRTALRLIARLRQQRRSASLWPLAIAMSAWSLGMAARGVYLLVVEQPAGVPLSANPTRWTTVLYFMVLLSIMTATFIWLDFGDRERINAATSPASKRQRLAAMARNQWIALGAVVGTLVLGTVGITAFYTLRVYDDESRVQQRLVEERGSPVADIESGVLARTRWVIVAAFAALAIILAMAAWLAHELKRRQEQERFLAMLSHELKTPLSVLRMALGRPGELSPRTRQHAEQSVRDIDAIVQRLIQADRLQYRADQFQLSACNAADIVRTVIAGSAEPDRFNVSTRGTLDVTTDPALFTIALQNLVDNALKYGAPGGIIDIDCADSMHESQVGVLIGIHHAVGPCGTPDPAKVFRKYYRSPQAKSKTGSGLGLYLVQTIAAQLKGWVRYEPDATGQRVRFELWLPR